MQSHSETGNGPNIISIASFLNDSRFPQIAQVEAYWEGLRDGRLMPRRSDINPRGIEGALEYAFILERIAPGIARMRIAGSHLTDLLGMEVRGMPASTFFPPAARNIFSETLEDVFSSPSTAVLDLTAEHGMGKPDMEAKMLLLPLKSDLGDVSRALGCLVTKGNIGRAPRRFEIQGVNLRPILQGTADASTIAPLTKTPGERIPGLADAQKRATPTAKQTLKSRLEQLNTGTSSYLRLVTNND